MLLHWNTDRRVLLLERIQNNDTYRKPLIQMMDQGLVRSENYSMFFTSFVSTPFSEKNSTTDWKYF